MKKSSILCCFGVFFGIINVFVWVLLFWAEGMGCGVDLTGLPLRLREHRGEGCVIPAKAGIQMLRMVRDHLFG